MEQQIIVQQNDEITLKELIQILLDYKWLIVGITASAVLLAAIYSFLILDPVYESTAVLNATPIGTNAIVNENIESIVDNSGLFPTGTIETYLEQLKSPQLLIAVINELNLVNEDGEALSIAALRNMFEVTSIEDTNLIEITVTSKNKEKAQKIANQIADDFIGMINEAGKNQSLNTASKVEAQLIIEEENLAEKSQELAEFLGESSSIDELKSEIASLVSQITSIKASMNNLEVSIASGKDKMEVLLPQLNGTEYVIDSLELNTSGNLTGQNISITDINDSALSDSLIVIEFVNTQNKYVTEVTKYDAYTIKLEQLEKLLVEKQAFLVEEEYKFDRLNRELSLVKQTYNAYQSRYQEAIVAAASEIGSNNIVISSEAIVPENPTGPNKTLNMAIGIVLGGMIGVFAAFFRAYWKKA